MQCPSQMRKHGHQRRENGCGYGQRVRRHGQLEHGCGRRQQECGCRRSKSTGAVAESMRVSTDNETAGAGTGALPGAESKNTESESKRAESERVKSEHTESKCEHAETKVRSVTLYCGAVITVPRNTI
jgi:hypothetical protein